MQDGSEVVENGVEDVVVEDLEETVEDIPELSDNEDDVEEISVENEENVEETEVVVEEFAADVPTNSRPKRNTKVPSHLKDYVVGAELDNVACVQDYGIEQFENVDFCFKTNITVPKTYKQAVASNEAEKWRDAMKEEIDSLLQNDTYTLVPLPEGKEVIDEKLLLGALAKTYQLIFPLLFRVT